MACRFLDGVRRESMQCVRFVGQGAAMTTSTTLTIRSRDGCGLETRRPLKRAPPETKMGSGVSLWSARASSAILGVDRIGAAVIIAELGVDMSVFATVHHAAAWAGVCAGNNESAGKRKGQPGHKGNVHLTTALVQASPTRSSSLPITCFATDWTTTTSARATSTESRSPSSKPVL